MVVAAKGCCAQSALCLFINKSAPMRRTFISGHAVRSRSGNIGILFQSKNAATEASYPESFAVEKMGCSDAYVGKAAQMTVKIILDEGLFPVQV